MTLSELTDRAVEPEWFCDENASELRVKYEGGKLRISGRSRVHFQRGLHLFLTESADHENEDSWELREPLDFREAGVLLDCSRNGAASLPFLRELIRLCAACGLGQLYLYMEDLYEIPEEPYFGAFRGRYSRRELEELDAYGQRLGVELIPAVQTLAHLHTFLRWAGSAPLRDTEDILLTGEKRTEEFIRSMIRNASLPFTTDRIHVGMDEAAMLGLGQYLRANGYEERYGIMSRHLDLVCGICRELGLKPMIWSDMFFRLQSPAGDYYDLPEDADFGEDLRIPEDLTLVYWDYYHHDRREYEKNLRLHRKVTDRICFAGGGWTWNGLAPNYRKAEKTLAEGIAVCREQKIDTAFCTLWFDNGAETPMSTAFYSIVRFAQLCYGEPDDGEKTDRWLRLLTGFGTEAYRILDEFDSPEGVLPENENADNPSKYLLYQDVLLGLFDAQTEGLELNRHYARLEEKLKAVTERGRKAQRETAGAGTGTGDSAAETGARMEEIFSYYHTLAEVLSEKAELGLKVRKAYLDQDREEVKRLCEISGKCARKVEELRRQRGEIWFRECRPFGFEVLDIRLGGVKVRLESAAARLESWLSGRTEILEELEEERLVYAWDPENPEHRLCAENLWEKIVSAGNMAGV